MLIEKCQYHHENGTYEDYLISDNEIVVLSNENVTFLTLYLLPYVILPSISSIQDHQDATWMREVFLRILSIFLLGMTPQCAALLSSCSSNRGTARLQMKLLENKAEVSQTQEVNIGGRFNNNIESTHLVSVKDCQVILGEVTLPLSSILSESAFKGFSSSEIVNVTPSSTTPYLHPVWKKRGPMHWDRTYTPIS